MIENFECTTFPTWDEMTEEDQLLSEISDVYKDINGFRPRSILNDMNVEDLRVFLADLHKQSREAYLRKEESQVASVVDFEKLISETQELCSCDRSSAVRFLIDAEEDPDVDYIEYSYNLPIGFLQKEVA